MFEVATPLVVALALAIGALLHQRVSRAAQPLRLELAAKGEDFIARSDVPPRAKRHVQFLLSTAFGMRTTLLLSLFIVPCYAVLIVFRQRFFQAALDEMRISDPTARAAQEQLAHLHDRITLANHPLLMPLVELMILAFIPLAIILRGAIRGSLASTITRESIMEVIEDRVPSRLAWNGFSRAVC